MNSEYTSYRNLNRSLNAVFSTANGLTFDNLGLVETSINSSVVVVVILDGVIVVVGGLCRRGR